MKISPRKIRIVLVAMICIILLFNVSAGWFDFLFPQQALTAEKRVEKNNIVIEADKEMYNCLPIMKDGKCLALITYNITNTDNKDKQYKITHDFKGKEKGITSSYVDKKQSKKIDANAFIIKKGETISLIAEVWASETQKFDIIVDINGIMTILDPIINVSINATYPSWYLLNGTNMVSNVDQYALKLDVTSGLTDMNTATAYYTSEGLFYSPVETIAEGWSFNDIITGSGVIKGFLGIVDGTVTSIVDTTQSTARFYDYGVTCDGTNDYITFPNNNRINFGSGDMTMSVIFNTSYNIATSSGILNKRVNPTPGYQIWYMSDETINCVWDGSATRTLSSTIKFNDGKIHVVVCKREANNFTMWVDGTLHQSGTTAVGNINNTGQLFMCSQDAGASRWQGTLWEASLMNTAISDEIIRGVGNHSRGDNVSLMNTSKGYALSVFFNHSIDAAENYSLYVNSLTTGLSVLRVQRYVNMTEVNKTKFQDYVITSGDNYLSLANLVYTGYNYPLRMWSLTGTADAKISEALLFETIFDNTNPIIKDYTVNDTSITCDESFMFSANISDNQAVQDARILVKANDYYTHILNHNGLYYFDFTSTIINNMMIAEGYPFNGQIVNISILQINATDIVGNKNSTNLTSQLVVSYSCNLCVEDWSCTPFTFNDCTLNTSYSRTCVDNHVCNTTVNKPAENFTADCNGDCKAYAQFKNYEFSTMDENPHYAYIYLYNGTRPVSDSSLVLDFNGDLITLSYNSANERYEGYFSFATPGEYPFTAYERQIPALPSYCEEPIAVQGIYHVYNHSFQSCVYIYTNRNATKSYDEAGWILLQPTSATELKYTLLDYLTGIPITTQPMEQQLSWLDKIAYNYTPNDPEMKKLTGKWFVAPYENGKACVDLYYPGYYKIKYIVGDLKQVHKYDDVYYRWKDVDVDLDKVVEITEGAPYLKYYITSWDVNAWANIRFIVIELLILLAAVIIGFAAYYVTMSFGIGFRLFIMIFLALSFVHLLILASLNGVDGLFKWFKYLL